MAKQTRGAGRSKGIYSVETISKKVAIETDAGGRVVLTDPEIEAVEFVSWGDVVRLGMKLLDIIHTGPTFPDPPSDDGDGRGGGGKGPVIIISGGSNITVEVDNR